MSTAAAPVATAAPPAVPASDVPAPESGGKIRPIPPKASGQAAVDAVLSSGGGKAGGDNTLGAVFGTHPVQSAPGPEGDSGESSDTQPSTDTQSSTDTPQESAARAAEAESEGAPDLVELKFRSGKSFKVPAHVAESFRAMAGRQAADARRLQQVEGMLEQYREANGKYDQSLRVLTERLQQMENGKPKEEADPDLQGIADPEVFKMVRDIDLSSISPDTPPDQTLKFALYELARRMKQNLRDQWEATVGEKVKPFEEERSTQEKIAAFRADLTHLAEIKVAGRPAFPELQDLGTTRDIIDKIMPQFQCEHDRVGMYKALLIYRDVKARQAEAAEAAASLPDAPETPAKGAGSVGLADSGSIPDAVRTTRAPENDALKILSQKSRRPRDEQSAAAIFGL
jgi:hypothetical protein